jgi:hypothetical protein
VDVAGGIRVHVAGRTEHVAAVGKIDDQIRTAPCLDAVCAVIVNHFVAGTIEVLAKPEALHPFEESRMIRKHVFKRAVLLAGLAHENAPCFLHDLRLDDSGPIPEVGNRLASPLITLSTASRLQSGQSDRVRLGTPVAIGIRSQLLGSGPGAQDGCGSLPCGKIELMFLAKDHAAFDIDR